MSDSEQGFGFSRRRVLELTGGTAAAAGVGAAAQDGEEPPGGGSGDGRSGATLTFDEPTRLNPAGQYGYEPSVDVDSHGTIYATAHKSSVVAEGDDLASFFWYSSDGGDTWQSMPSVADVDDLQYALEGDISIDSEDRINYVDLYLADNHMNRWLTEPSGPVWDYSKPVQGTSEAVDDRPWINSHGDGIVYYLGNNGVSPPAPNDLTDGDTDPDDRSRIWFYRSTDGGLTFTLGFGLPSPEYCSIAASKNVESNKELEGKKIFLSTVGANKLTSLDGDGPAIQTQGTQYLEVFWSTNAGQDFVYDGKDHDDPIYEFEYGSNNPFPTWAETDRAGNPFVFTTDDDPEDDEQGKLIFARGRDEDFTKEVAENASGKQGSERWDTFDLTDEVEVDDPDVVVPRTYTKPWVAAGSEGLVALAFYGAPEVKSGNKTWHTYALASPNALSDDPDWFFTQVTDEPVSETLEPEDFFECAVGPDDDIHITYGRNLDSAGMLSNPTRTYRNNMFHVRGRIEGFDGGDDDTATRTPTDTPTETPTDTPTDTPTPTPDSFTVSGSRSDDGSVFTGGQANTVTLDVKASERAEVRDPIPSNWELVGNSGEQVTIDGQKYVLFDGSETVPPRGDGEDPVTRKYIVEAPEGVGETGRYTFGPAEANSVAAPENWKEFGSSDTNNVVGADQNDV